MTTPNLSILIVAAEVAPFAKVGGLADVAGALPKALRALGHDVRVVMPCYRMVEENPHYAVSDLLAPFPVRVSDGDTQQAWVRQTTIGDTPVYLIGGHPHFAEATESRKVYSLEADPYIFFDRAVAEAIPRLSPAWAPDVVHCNDWHTGLLPVYLDLFYGDHPTWASAACVYTIHNLAYQGDFEAEVLPRAGLPETLLNMHQLEFYGRMSFMKGGLVFSRLVNTVSPTYAAEIQTPEFGCRLEGLLTYLAAQGRLTGILNGIDYLEYDPLTDRRIPAQFGPGKPEGKQVCKAQLQAECGLPVRPDAALIGIVSRLADQKGFDLIHAAASALMEMPVQLIVLGTGEPRYESFFAGLGERLPQKVKAHIGFDANLAQRIYAGSDMFLMPSRFEPCGLGQMMSLRYGTIPVVRSTGGLADTIHNYDPHTGEGNGFAFAEYTPDRLLECVGSAVETFADVPRWASLVDNALRSDFSWVRSAQEYAELYARARGLASASRA